MRRLLAFFQRRGRRKHYGRRGFESSRRRQRRHIRRALTLPLPQGAQTDRGKVQKTDSQQQSLFYKLPLEIRQRIYGLYFDYAAGDAGDFLSRRGARQKAHIFGSDRYRVVWHAGCMSNSDNCTARCYAASRYQQPDWDLLSLLRTCRGMYALSPWAVVS